MSVLVPVEAAVFHSLGPLAYYRCCIDLYLPLLCAAFLPNVRQGGSSRSVRKSLNATCLHTQWSPWYSPNQCQPIAAPNGNQCCHLPPHNKEYNSLCTRKTRRLNSISPIISRTLEVERILAGKFQVHFHPPKHLCIKR